MKLPITLLALGVAATVTAGFAHAQPPRSALGLRAPVSAGPVYTRASKGVKPGARAKRFEKKGTAAQKAWAKSFVAERAQLHARVKAGTLTKKSAHQQRHSWLTANKPPHK